MAPTTTPISVRFRQIELDRIDRLKDEMHLPSRAEVLRTAVGLLAADESGGYRTARAAENQAIEVVDELREVYGSHARADFEFMPDGTVDWTIEGQVPPGELRAEVLKQDEIAVLRIHDDLKSLALQPGIAFRWEDVSDEGASASLPLASFYPRVGADGQATPKREPSQRPVRETD
jgi:hypothetical protein